MTTWKVVADSDRYRSLLPVDADRAAALFQKFDGRRLKGTWKPLAVKVYKVGRAGDFPALAGHIPVFSERALLHLGPSLKETAEALPLKCDEGAFFAINVIRVVDCLDPARAEVSRFSTGRILSIDRYAFYEDRLPDAGLFKLPEEPLQRPFATNAFRNSVLAHKLKGLIFEKV